MILDKFSLNGKAAVAAGSDTGLGQGFLKADERALGVSEYIFVGR